MSPSCFAYGQILWQIRSGCASSGFCCSVVIRVGEQVPGFYHRVQGGYNDQGEECCVLSQEEVIGLPIRPLPCLPSAIEPAVPALRKWPAPHEHIEMRLPCCGSCDTAGGACSGPGMTDWFVVWPSETDGVVRSGPARGWRVDSANDALWSPGADGLKYQFSDQYD